MKVTPVKGTNDYLPKEVEIRDYLQQKILEVYLANGFEHIITPVIEDIENLDKSDGGENLNLIFKIMKRGDKLDKALASGVTSENENVLADMGLRYDLTLPLSRYYANNKDKLTLPMKCIQMDRVYRAERPQKGRLREFIQCDIDIIGSESNDSEIELILTTTKALQAIGMKNFKVKLNDRRLLRAVLMQMGFAENELDSVCITFDKLDKIGMDGVEAELTEKGFAKEAITKFTQFLEKNDFSLDSLKDMLEDSSEIDEIMINPSSKDTVCIDLDSFFDLFAIKNNSNDWIFEKARPLNQEVKVYYREFEPLMKKQAIGGVYSSKNPFKASVNMHFEDHIPYLNVLILPKDTKTVYLGGMMDPEMSCDILLAPETEFKFISQEDEHTMIWKCVNQKFYD